MFIICGLLYPLITSLIADRRIILSGLVPNIVMSACLTIYVAFFPAEGQEWVDTIYLIFIIFWDGLFLALLVTAPLYLLRKRLKKEE